MDEKAQGKIGYAYLTFRLRGTLSQLYANPTRMGRQEQVGGADDGATRRRLETAAGPLRRTSRAYEVRSPFARKSDQCPIR